MKNRFADRMNNIQETFITDILKVTANPKIISFAGGLPNPEFFPEKEIQAACVKVLEQDGRNVLQYSTAEGYGPLRQYIADRYKKKGLQVEADDILITNGSQQGLDLISKVFLNKGDYVLTERPGYLGAIDAISIFEPTFLSVPLLDDGVDTGALENIIKAHDIKLFYTVPNFQNPSGVSYSEENRAVVADILKQSDTILIEDDPYGELRFIGEHHPYISSHLGEQAILLGSFSKIVAPGLRMGWICTTNKAVMEKLASAKQAADLHSNYLSQRVIHQYLMDNDIDEHIKAITKVYKEQRDIMIKAIEEHFPPEVKYTQPEGGMFLWITLPEGISCLELFEAARRENVAFVPGLPFYTDGGGCSTLRMNFSNSDEEKIREGIERLAKAIKALL